ncbi:hypothetical protein AUJ46_04940 [Candidatus Peregrinibacteria bacterium CG1_02_54_53]|nr:MAG: hypothetical protein AUJ46_04940 [Candidatus Peregrinibacteria bacterium CG1_02_54_53]
MNVLRQSSIYVLLGIIGLLFTACSIPGSFVSPPESGREEDVMVSSQAMIQTSSVPADAMQPDTAAMAKGEYVAYHEGVIGDGQTSVLFFHATWCPVCKRADTSLRGWYAGDDAFLTTYKVDYDTQKELKKRYGITYQHTFIKIDGQGNAIGRLEGPNDADLLAFLQP